MYVNKSLFRAAICFQSACVWMFTVKVMMIFEYVLLIVEQAAKRSFYRTPSS